MPTDARLLALPSLRRQAESTFRERRSAAAELLRSHGKFNFAELIEDDEDVATSIEVEAALLADLTRWQSQAWALRRIAELVRFSIGDSVPTIRLIPDEKRVVWIVECGTEAHCFTLPDATSRPEAIAAILLHLESQ